MKDKDNTLLFVSYDIVNSSAYKYRHNQWAHLYKDIFETLNRSITKFQFSKWKINGDEILFKKNLEKCNIEEDILKADCIMSESLNTIYNDSKIRSQFHDIKQISLRTTLWVADILEIQEIDKDIPEPFISDVSIHLNGIDDYFGKEMDTGFRISSYVPRAKTGLSAAIMHVLFQKDSDLLRKIRLLGYEELKGIWNNKRYPLFIYFRKEDKEEIVKSFHYNETEDDTIRKFIEKMKRDEETTIEKSEFYEILDYIGVRQYYLEVF